MESRWILVRGAGDLATGAIRRLFIAGFRIVATEVERPLVVRRGAAFASAVFEKEVSVEGVTAVLTNSGDLEKDLSRRVVPVLVDRDAEVMKERSFDVLVDARMLKKKTGVSMGDAPVVIGIGPGFEAGVDCHAVVETLLCEDLGRVILSGRAAPNTGVPTPADLDVAARLPGPGAFNTLDFVLFAGKDGLFETERNIGETVEKGDVLGSAGGEAVTARAGGVLRGLLHTGVRVRKGTKLVEVDPSGDASRCFRVSAKSNAVAGGVLEAAFKFLNAAR